VIPSKGSEKVSHSQTFLPPFPAVGWMGTIHRSSFVRLHRTEPPRRSALHLRQAEPRPLPHPMRKRNLTRPGKVGTQPTCGCFRRRDTRARDRGHVRHGGCGRARRIHSIHHVRAAGRPATLLVTAGCTVSFFFRVTTRVAGAAGSSPGKFCRPRARLRSVRETPGSASL
jgi:hypothetical protein